MDTEELIINYLNGNLSDDKKAEVEMMLSGNADFREQYTELKSMYIFTAKEEDKTVVQEQLNSLSDKYFESGPTENTYYNKVKNIILGLVLLSAVALLLWLYNTNKQPVNIYQQYAQHFPIHLTQKSSNTTLQSKSEQAFNNNKYEESYLLLKEYVITNQENANAQLALGISALETKKYEEALEIFDKIENSKSSFRNIATWYKALLEVKRGNNEKAKQILKTITASDKTLDSKVQKLMKAL